MFVGILHCCVFYISQSISTQDLDKSILTDIITKVEEKLEHKRPIMYVDLINFIIRTNLVGDEYNKIIVWCNYNIRLGRLFMES